MSKGRSASSYLPRSGHRHESTSPSHAVHLAEPLSKVKVSAVAHAYERVCKQLLRRGPALGLLAQALADEVPELRREGIGLQHGGRAGGWVGRVAAWWWAWRRRAWWLRRHLQLRRLVVEDLREQHKVVGALLLAMSTPRRVREVAQRALCEGDAERPDVRGEGVPAEYGGPSDVDSRGEWVFLSRQVRSCGHTWPPSQVAAHTRLAAQPLGRHVGVCPHEGSAHLLG